MATLTPTWRLPAQSESCRFVARRSPTRTRIPEGVDQELRKLSSQRPAVEVGGLLIGVRTAKLIEALEVTRPGPKAVCARNSFLPDLEHDLRIADELREHGNGLTVCGEWHSHLA